MRKSLWLVALGLALSLAGCAGQAKADTVKPLAHTTALATDGVVAEAKMATMTKGHYVFTGKASSFAYAWDYDAAQVKNPTVQKLAVQPVTAGRSQAMKAAAGQEVVGLSLAKFSLAGSPKLTVTISERWASSQAVLVQQNAGKLRRVDQQVSLQKAAAKTQLTLHITNRNLNTKLYLVGIKAQATPSAKATSAGKAAEAAKAAADKAAAAHQSAAATASTQAAEASSAATAGDASQSVPANSSAPTAGATGQPQANAPAATQTVTLSISAATAAAHPDQIAANKRQFVPSSGWILAPTKVTLQSGDTAYSLLARLTKQHGIQLESRYTPAYGSYYVSGIHNLYEFDGGAASGWTYSVDGWFPNYGASEYSSLKPGSVVNWVYTLQLGQDVGAGSW